MLFLTIEDGMYEDMKKAIAMKLEVEFPLAPESVLEFCLRNGKLPTWLDYNHICQEIFDKSHATPKPENKKSKIQSELSNQKKQTNETSGIAPSENQKIKKNVVPIVIQERNFIKQKKKLQEKCCL